MVEGPLDFFWFTSTADWGQRILVTGLIALIPIVGAINVLGWTLVATDMIRQRWKELPPAGFQYIERGVAPFVVQLVYGVIVLFVIIALFVGGLILIFSQRSLTTLGAILILLAVLLLVAWWLISVFFLAAILIGSDRLGLGRAIDPAVLIRLARQNFHVSFQAGLIYGVAALALGLVTVIIGVIIPFGGLLVSIALPGVYAMTVPRLAEFEVHSPTPLPPSAVP
jgi:hypothetical protein